MNPFKIPATMQRPILAPPSGTRGKEKTYVSDSRNSQSYTTESLNTTLMVLKGNVGKSMAQPTKKMSVGTTRRLETSEERRRDFPNPILGANFFYIEIQETVKNGEDAQG